MNSNYTWINGEMIASDKATVPFLTSGFHYGIAIFEGIRAYKTNKGLAVFAYANYVAPTGWPVVALTPFKHPTLQLQAAKIAVQDP